MEKSIASDSFDERTAAGYIHPEPNTRSAPEIPRVGCQLCNLDLDRLRNHRTTDLDVLECSSADVTRDRTRAIPHRESLRALRGHDARKIRNRISGFQRR